MTTPTREQVIERSRIDFECYFLESRKSKGANRVPTFHRYEHDGTYIDDHTQRHWWTWQQAVNAGRAQGLREAYDIALRAPFKQPELDAEEWESPEAAHDAGLKSMAFDITSEIRAAIEQLRGE